jgi:hypothetical protein
VSPISTESHLVLMYTLIRVRKYLVLKGFKPQDI